MSGIDPLGPVEHMIHALCRGAALSLIGSDNKQRVVKVEDYNSVAELANNLRAALRVSVRQSGKLTATVKNLRSRLVERDDYIRELEKEVRRRKPMNLRALRDDNSNNGPSMGF